MAVMGEPVACKFELELPHDLARRESCPDPVERFSPLGLGVSGTFNLLRMRRKSNQTCQNIDHPPLTAQKDTLCANQYRAQFSRCWFRFFSIGTQHGTAPGIQSGVSSARVNSAKRIAAIQ